MSGQTKNTFILCVSKVFFVFARDYWQMDLERKKCDEDIENQLNASTVLGGFINIISFQSLTL